MCLCFQVSNPLVPDRAVRVRDKAQIEADAESVVVVLSGIAVHFLYNPTIKESMVFEKMYRL